MTDPFTSQRRAFIKTLTDRLKYSSLKVVFGAHCIMAVPLETASSIPPLSVAP